MMRRQTENARIVQRFLRKPENTISVPNADAYSINTAMRSAEVTAYIMIKQTPSLNFFSGQIKASQSMSMLLFFTVCKEGYYRPSNDTGNINALSFSARTFRALSITMPRIIGILYFSSTLKFLVGLLGTTLFFISTG